jgi:hypothetical protein
LLKKGELDKEKTKERKKERKKTNGREKTLGRT